MGSRHQHYVWVLGVYALLAGFPYPVQAQTPEMNALRKSDIVFVGTVDHVGAVSFPQVPVSQRTIVVSVALVIEKPQAVVLKRGDQITVLEGDTSRFKQGDQATFYTEGWIYGKGIAVLEVGHDVAQGVLTEAALNEYRNRVMQMRKEINDADLRATIEGADVVVVGEVTAVQPGPKGAVRGVSEHNPDWQEAVIRISSSIKGAQGLQNVVVRFPGSKDVSWYRVPKFNRSQEGTFILMKDQVSGTPKATLAGILVQAYTALDPRDVLSKDEAEHVRSLAAQANKKTKGT